METTVLDLGQTFFRTKTPEKQDPPLAMSAKAEQCGGKELDNPDILFSIIFSQKSKFTNQGQSSSNIVSLLNNKQTF